MNIAINGFGRIGRTFFRVAHELGLNIIAANDLTDVKTLAHLLNYDSTYGKFVGKVEVAGSDIKVDGKRVKILAEKDPKQLPWKNMNVDIVVESTGIFTDYDSAYQHIEAGANMVIITAPAKEGKPVKTYVLGVNEEKFNKDDKVVSMASCTTNCLTPVMDVLHKKFGVKSALMSTVHSFTMDQVLQDSPHKDLRRARSALQSIIPTTTGATKATAEVIPELKGKMDGLAYRVPTATVSVVDVAVLLKKEATAEELNQAFVEASKQPKYKGALSVTDEQLVSADFKGNPNASIVDLSLTQSLGNFVKIVSWYDNELGYSYRLAEFVKYIASKI